MEIYRLGVNIAIENRRGQSRSKESSLHKSCVTMLSSSPPLGPAGPAAAFFPYRTDVIAIYRAEQKRQQQHGGRAFALALWHGKAGESVRRKTRHALTQQHRVCAQRSDGKSPARTSKPKDANPNLRVAELFETDAVDEIFARIDQSLENMNSSQLSQTWLLLGKRLQSEDMSSLTVSQKAAIDRLVTFTCDRTSSMTRLNWAGVFQGCACLDLSETHENILKCFSQWLSKSKAGPRKKGRFQGDDSDARSISNIIYSLARIRMEVPLPVWVDLLDSVDDACPRANAQDISNIMWALGRLDILPSQRVFQTLEWRICNIADELPPRVIAMIFWSYARMGITPHSLVLEKLNDRVMNKEVCFNSVDVANIYWAHGKLALGVTSGLERRLETSLLKALPEMKLKEIINVVWSYAQRAESPSKSTLEEIEGRIRSLTNTNLDKKSKQSAVKAILSAYKGFQGTVPTDILKSFQGP